ncbi:VOC family protein [Streptomyces sp. V1I1]|uniref:VOC family protein n=1 Tax=Streptomyces sp. V1I1 TaxID=3042272 RepID=UPI002787E04F|nr:VOC family protein [Streptomyces sp. V1I1]MDQ0945045.1 catechol 2,3-dioxygenase-like lactoylglutathione lyase family enzyme [Streptomyces sp. V1I1]
MRAQIDEIVFDCHDPASLVRFWASLLGGDPVDRSADWSYIDPPGFVRVAFQRVPEGKSAKNRLHLDLDAGEVDEAADEAVRLGAARLGAVVTNDHGRFQVLTDPEGNEFCFVAAGGQ